jgi:4-carboxymuconolactone decarboxylase
LVSLTDEVVFGDIWERPGLSKRDRSLITVSALVSLYRTEQMESHMRRAIDNGVTLDELIEAITHLAFYAGWPNAITAMTLARRLFEQ